MLDWGGGRFAAAAPVELSSFGAKSLRRTRNQEQEEEGEEEEEDDDDDDDDDDDGGLYH